MKCPAIGGLCAVPLLALVFAGNAWPQGVISGFADAQWVFTGNGQPAVNAPLGFVYGVIFDPSGNLVIADNGNGLVERVNADGTLTVIAGNGFFYHTGDGGPAVNAAVNSPTGIAYDSKGNLYIAEKDRISEVSPQGIINIVAGGGSDATSNGIPALQAAVAPNLGFVVDSTGVVYFTETSNNRVRKIALDGTISTVAGTGTAGFSGDGGPAAAAELDFPNGLALDQAGNLYIADSNNARVREVTTTGIISSVAPGIIATGLAFDKSGNFYLAGGGEIFKATPGFTSFTRIGGVPGSAGFSGDGGQALVALFPEYMSVVADTAGNIYIGDENDSRVRRISASGIVTTVAGNGQFYYTGEGVPAALTPILPGGNLAIDKAGNLYYSDPFGGRVRKATAGIINSVAGNGTSGFLGDGGSASQAALYQPRGLALDPSGNLYIADYINNRVRRVVNGTISTFAQLPGQVWGLAFDAAGNLYVSVQTNSTVYRIDPKGNQTVFAGTGTSGYSGDGGAATQAMLNAPSGLAMDAAGNLYIADSLNGRVRVVSPQGVISTLIHTVVNSSGAPVIYRELAFDSAGNLYVSDQTANVVHKYSTSGTLTVFAGGGNFAPGDGKLATQAIPGTPYGIVCDASGNVYIEDTNGIQVVLASPPTISLQQASLSLSAASGGAPVTQPIAVLGSVSGLDFTVSATTASGGNWLSAGVTAGSTPELLSITADPSNLAAGTTYTGTVTVVPVAAIPAGLQLTVTFKVGPAIPPQLSVDQPSLSFTYPKGAPSRSATLTVSNTGGGALPFTVSTNTNTGGSWLTVTPLVASVSPGAPVTLSVTANPSGLATGNYTGSISIQPSVGAAVTIPVNMGISSLTQALLLTQTGMSFTAVAQGGVVPPQSFGVVNLGTGSLGWTASAAPLVAGVNWLSVTPPSGSSDPSLAAPQVTVSVDPSGLAAGDYYGLVTIDAPNAPNSPQVVSVFLTVLQAGSDPGASVQPSELFYSVAPGPDGPGSQQVLVYDIGAAAKTFYTGFTSSQFSLAAKPGIATLNPGQPTPVLVQPNGAFQTGSFTDYMNFQFSDGRVATVKVHVIAATPAGAVANARREASGPCAPTKLIPALPSLPEAFATLAGYPNALSVQVLDDCGNPHLTGSVTVSFDNGDPELELSSLNNGIWQGTWSVGSQSSGQPVSLSIMAVNPQAKISGSLEVDGSVGSSKSPPAFTKAGIVSAAAPASYTAVAPGSIISVYGSLLADSANSAQNIPLPSILGNTIVKIGGKTAPLFYASDGQINAVVPFGLNTNTTQQMLIQRDETVSSPVPVDVADAQPGVFLYGGSGIVEDYRGSSAPFLVTGAMPAMAGDILVFYCGGLGVVNQPVMDGAASPSATTQFPVAVSIGGQNAKVLFAGLVYGLVGLYQVNVAMPSGVGPGTAAVTLTVAGQASPVANLSTQ